MLQLPAGLDKRAAQLRGTAAAQARLRRGRLRRRAVLLAAQLLLRLLRRRVVQQPGAAGAQQPRARGLLGQLPRRHARRREQVCQRGRALRGVGRRPQQHSASHLQL